MPRRLLLEGAAIEPLLRQARAEHGQSARIVKAEKVRVGGVGGFFAKERYEVTVEVDDEAGPAPEHPAAPAAPAPDVPEPSRAEPPSKEAAVAMLQELPSSLASSAAAEDGTEPADRPMTRRERRRAEAAEAADVDLTGADLPDADPPRATHAGADVSAADVSGADLLRTDPDAGLAVDAGPSVAADDRAAGVPVEDADHVLDAADDDPSADEDLTSADHEPPVDGDVEPVRDPDPAPAADGSDEPADHPAPDDGPESLLRPGPAGQDAPDAPVTTIHDEPLPLPELPTTLAGLGEPEPGEALPDLPAVPAALAEPAVPAVPAVPSGEQQVPAPVEPARADLGSAADRLERLGLDRRWLQDVPDDLPAALRQLARRLAASPPRPRRSPRASDNPLVAVLAEDAGGLETARTLAVGLGLRADQVTVLTSGGAAGARSRAGTAPALPSGVPLDRAAAARAAHGGRRRTAPAVVLVPTPFAASPGERAAAAAVLASLDADQVWAVVDATRRTSDVEGWLRTVGPPSGVDAVALVGTGSTTAPAASLRLSAPVVLLDGRPATAVDWVVNLAAHLVREDLEDHLGPHDGDVADGGPDGGAPARGPA